MSTRARGSLIRLLVLFGALSCAAIFADVARGGVPGAPADPTAATATQSAVATVTSVATPIVQAADSVPTPAPPAATALPGVQTGTVTGAPAAVTASLTKAVSQTAPTATHAVADTVTGAGSAVVLAASAAKVTSGTSPLPAPLTAVVRTATGILAEPGNLAATTVTAPLRVGLDRPASGGTQATSTAARPGPSASSPDPVTGAASAIGTHAQAGSVHTATPARAARSAHSAAQALAAPFSANSEVLAGWPRARGAGAPAKDARVPLPPPGRLPGIGALAAFAGASGGGLLLFGLLGFLFLLAIPNAVRWLRSALALGLSPAYVAPSDRPG
jgi:hypothetical protein